jgi:hypothetical protein
VGVLAVFLPFAAVAQIFGPSGGELRVNTYTTGIQGGGAVAMDETGNFVVFWSGDGPDGPLEVYAQRYSFNAPAGAQFRVNATTAGNQGSPAASGRGAASFVAVWPGPDGDSYGVFGRRLSSGGTFLGGDFQANTTTTGYQSYAGVATDSSGNFVVVWTTPGTDQMPDVMARRYSSSGGAIGGPFRVNTYSTGTQAGPAVARSDAGFVIVWQSGDQPAYGSSGIYGQRYDSGGASLGGPFFVNSVYLNGAANPDVSMDGSGAFVVVWQATAESLTEIYARRYDVNGNALTPEFRVNTATTDIQSAPAVSEASGGSFVVVWHGGDLYGGAGGIFAQRYAASGVPAGSAFRVNTTTAGYVFSGRVAHDLVGDFVIAWTQGDSGTQDVRLRRYCVNLRGDANADGSIDVADVFYLINHLFAGGPLVGYGDANGDGTVDIGDVFFEINFLFAGGPPPSCQINLI